MDDIKLEWKQILHDYDKEEDLKDDVNNHFVIKIKQKIKKYSKKLYYQSNRTFYNTQILFHPYNNTNQRHSHRNIIYPSTRIRNNNNNQIDIIDIQTSNYFSFSITI